jgi:LPXTG-motif cell wall-anchored protein
MTRTLLRLLLTTGGGLVLAFGGVASAAAETEGAATAECPSPKWQVTWTSEDADTLRECGGETVAAHSDTTGSQDEAAATSRELPKTNGPAAVAALAAIMLVGLGAGLYLVSRRQRHVFMT